MEEHPTGEGIDMIQETQLKMYSKADLEEYENMEWVKVAKLMCEDQGFELLEIAPNNSIIDYRMCFMVGKGVYFTFNVKDDDTLRHGFVYLRIEGDVAFIEVTDK